MIGNIDNSEDVDAARDRVRVDRLIDSIDKAFAPLRLAMARAKVSGPLAKTSNWHQLDTHIGDDFMVEVFYDVDGPDDAGRHAVCIHEVQVVGDSGSTIELSRKSQARIKELCLSDWLANHKH